MGSAITYSSSPHRGEVDARSAAGEGARRAFIQKSYTLTLFTPPRERVIAGERQLSADVLQHAFHVFEYVVVPEADDPVAETFDHGGAGRIMLDRMLTAVQFDYQSGRPASEVGYISADWKLPDELGVLELAKSNMTPESLLGVGASPAQAARDAGMFLLGQYRTPSPCPLPVGERNRVVRHISIPSESPQIVNA